MAKKDVAKPKTPGKAPAGTKANAAEKKAASPKTARTEKKSSVAEKKSPAADDKAAAKKKPEKLEPAEKKPADKKATKPAAAEKKPAQAAEKKPKATKEPVKAPAPSRPETSPRFAEKPQAPEPPVTVSSEVERLKADLARSRAETEKAKKALKELDGERRRLTNIAAQTERALTEEAHRRSTLEQRLEATGDLAAAQAKVSELKLKVEASHAEIEQLKGKIHHGERLEAELQAMNFERSTLAKRVADLEALSGKPSPQLIDELRKEAEARAESKVRALTNERDGLRSRLKELEATPSDAADRSKIERLEEKCMDLERERDSYKERLTEAESQITNAPAPEVVDRLKTSLADAERDRDRYREKVIDLEAQVVAMRGGLPIAHHGRMSSAELQSRLEEAEREREKAERERDELETRVHALKTDLYAKRTAPEEASGKRFCPGCGTEMKPTISSSVHMDVCPQCSGVYFGKGDIASIVAQEREVVKQSVKGSFFGRIFAKVGEK